MTEAERHILLDIFLVTSIAVAIAVPVFTVIRRQNPELGWNTHGNVWTSPFGLGEAGICFLTFYLAWSALKGAPDEMPLPTVAGVLQGSLFFLALATGVCIYFVWAKRVDLMELFGLERMKGGRLVGISLAWFVPAGLLGAATKWGFDSFVWRVAGLDLENQSLVVAVVEGSAELKIAIFASAVIIAPIAEEVIFRGVIYTCLKRYSERYFAAVASSILFALIHANLASFAPLFVLGMFFALAYEITGNLSVPVLMHSFFNLASLLFILGAH